MASTICGVFLGQCLLRAMHGPYLGQALDAPASLLADRGAKRARPRSIRKWESKMEYMRHVELMWIRLLCVSTCVTLAKDAEKGLGVKD